LSEYRDPSTRKWRQVPSDLGPQSLAKAGQRSLLAQERKRLEQRRRHQRPSHCGADGLERLLRRELPVLPQRLEDPMDLFGIPVVDRLAPANHVLEVFRSIAPEPRLRPLAQFDLVLDAE